jgi:hypothetical protein
MDARDVTPPFTPGALRGGTHRHEPDATGKWVGYTYNDQIMHALGKDLRTIGVTQLGNPVKTDRDPKGENHDGEGWSVLVVRVTPDPKPGSDEINQAASDSWVGTHGYQRADGKRQLARAFLGRVKDKNETGNLGAAGGNGRFVSSAARRSRAAPTDFHHRKEDSGCARGCSLLSGRLPTFFHHGR